MKHVAKMLAAGCLAASCMCAMAGCDFVLTFPEHAQTPSFDSETSEEVTAGGTDSEWEAAFAYENFDNFTARLVRTITNINSGFISPGLLSGKIVLQRMTARLTFDGRREFWAFEGLDVYGLDSREQAIWNQYCIENPPFGDGDQYYIEYPPYEGSFLENYISGNLDSSQCLYRIREYGGWVDATPGDDLYPLGLMLFYNMYYSAKTISPDLYTYVQGEGYYFEGRHPQRPNDGTKWEILLKFKDKKISVLRVRIQETDESYQIYDYTFSYGGQKLTLPEIK